MEKLYKVITIDNYGRDYNPDTLITVGLPKEDAEIIMQALNQNPKGDRYVEIVPVNKKLCYEDIHDCNGMEKTFDQFVSSRDIGHLPLNVQEFYYNTHK